MVELVLTQASTLNVPREAAEVFCVIEPMVKPIARFGDSEVSAPVWLSE